MIFNWLDFFNAQINDFSKIGIESFENENFELALENFELNIELNKIHLPSYFYKALTLKKMKKYDESLKSFSEIIKLDGTFYTTYFHMAEIMIEYKDYQKANLYIDIFISKNPHSHEGKYIKSSCGFGATKHKSNYH